MAYPNQSYYGNPIIGGGTGAYNTPNYFPPAPNTNQMTTQPPAQIPTMQQLPPQPMVLPGKMVTEERKIVPNEVPNNGNYALYQPVYITSKEGD